MNGNLFTGVMLYLNISPFVRLGKNFSCTKRFRFSSQTFYQGWSSGWMSVCWYVNVCDHMLMSSWCHDLESCCDWSKKNLVFYRYLESWMADKMLMYSSMTAQTYKIAEFNIYFTLLLPSVWKQRMCTVETFRWLSISWYQTVQVCNVSSVACCHFKCVQTLERNGCMCFSGFAWVLSHRSAEFHRESLHVKWAHPA